MRFIIFKEFLLISLNIKNDYFCFYLFIIKMFMNLREWIDSSNLNYEYLSGNINAIELLKANPDKINWKYLSRNLSPDAIELFRKNQDKINWNSLSFNPLIFTYDYEKIKKNFEELAEEIIAKALHPKRIFRLIEEYGEDEIYNIYFDDY